MSDNYKENEELTESQDTEDVVDEAMEKAVGEAELADAAQAVTEEGMSESTDVSGTEPAEEPSVEYAIADSGLEDVPVRKSKGIVIGIIIALIVAVLAGAGVMAFFVARAPYNYLGYINVGGRTIQDIADLQEVSLSEFLETYSLPADMPGSTIEEAAYYTIPTGVIAQMYGLDFDTMKEMLELPDSVSDVSLRLKLIDAISNKFNIGTVIDENTPWGIAEGEISVGVYVGEENFDAFKQEYGLDDNITADTKWKYVRPIIDKETIKQQKELEKSQSDADISDDDYADYDISDDASITDDDSDAAASDSADAAEAAN
jgi:hypothetical protein